MGAKSYARAVIAVFVGALAILSTDRASAVNPTFPGFDTAQWQTTDGAALAKPGDPTDFGKDGFTYMRIGRIWHAVEPRASTGWNTSWAWPAGISYAQWASYYTERYGSYSQQQQAILGAKGWSATIGGTNYPLDYFVNGTSDGGLEQFEGDPIDRATYMALENAQIQRWLPPQVYVNGKQYTDQTETFGLEPGSPADGVGNTEFGKVRGVIDPTLGSERSVLTAYRFSAGVDVFQQIHGYSSGADQDYLLYDYHFVNTGNMDFDADRERTAAVDAFRYGFKLETSSSHVSPLVGDASTDDIVEWINPWPSYTSGGNHHTVAMYYDGDDPGTTYPDWGGPGGISSGNTPLGWDLWAKGYMAVGWLFVEGAPGSGADDPAQPKSTAWNLFATGFGVGSSDLAALWRAAFSGGNADDAPRRVDESITSKDAGLNGERICVYQSIAWDQLAANATGHAVLVVAAGGLNDLTSRSIARNFRIRSSDSSIPPADRLTQPEIALIKTGRDSARKTLDRAFWNVYGNDPNGARWANKPSDQNRAFNVADPPRPPACLWANSGNGKIRLTWSDEPRSALDPDKGVADFQKYRVYRTVGSNDSTMQLIWEGTGNEYVDEDVSKDFVYYYSVSAIDDGTQNWEKAGNRLESGKFWVWTGWFEDAGIRPSGQTAETRADLANIVVVPNPYHTALQFPVGAKPNEIVWKNLPESCTISVFSMGGDLVHRITHTGGGSEPWNMRTENNQYIASGVYIYTVESTLGTHVAKFVVVR